MSTAPSEEMAHAVEKLGFEEVLRLVSCGARSPRSGGRILSTRLLDSIDDIERSQREMLELIELAACDEHLPLSEWVDSFGELSRIKAEGAAATCEQLVAIASGEKTARAVRSFIEKRQDRLPEVSRYLSGLSDHGDLTRQISDAIGPEHCVRDTASPALSRLRKRIEALRSRLRKEFAGFAGRRGGGKGYEFVTVRGERYVVSLPRSEAESVKGIVHHASASGASLYIEPLELVEENNRLESLVGEERREVERILRELTGEVFRRREGLLRNQDALLALDIVSAKAAFARRFDCIKPEHSSDGALVLLGARHPLLEKRFSEEDPENAVIPMDLRCGPELRGIVISGPNAGGKTVALKTVGLLTVMDRAGLLLPCSEGTRIPASRSIFVDIGDDQSIERSLSTFSSRIVRLSRILALADGGSLVLIDEIGDATDPEEGAAIARAVLDILLQSGCRTIVTTHLRALKVWAYEAEGAVNASMEFDSEKLQPLYRIRLGIPGRSWGIEMAGRFGLPESILDAARRSLGTDILRMEELLAHLESLERKMVAEQEELVRKENMLAGLIDSYRDRLDRFKKDREELDQSARKEALDIVSSTRREMENLIREIRISQAEREVIAKARRRLGERKEDFKKELRVRRRAEGVALDELEPGKWVTIKSIDKPGKVVSVEGPARVFLELAGGLKVETVVEDLARVERAFEPVGEVGRVWHMEPIDRPVTGEISIRGMLREDALEKVDKFIDSAVLQGLRHAVIIHGVGRGILKKAVYDMLRKDPRVRDIHPGEPALGGDGVAVVELK